MPCAQFRAKVRDFCISVTLSFDSIESCDRDIVSAILDEATQIFELLAVFHFMPS